MMMSKVKPLHAKVEETTKTVNEAAGKLSVLQSKLEDLQTRLSSLAKAYEEASIDKCRQFKLTEKLNQQLERASYFEKVRIHYKFTLYCFASEAIQSFWYVIVHIHVDKLCVEKSRLCFKQNLPMIVHCVNWELIFGMYTVF